MGLPCKYNNFPVRTSYYYNQACLDFNILSEKPTLKSIAILGTQICFGFFVVLISVETTILKR